MKPTLFPAFSYIFFLIIYLDY